MRFTRRWGRATPKSRYPWSNKCSARARRATGGCPEQDVATIAACDAAAATIVRFFDDGAVAFHERCSTLEGLEGFLAGEATPVMLSPWPRWSNAARLLGRDIDSLTARYRSKLVPHEAHLLDRFDELVCALRTRPGT